eukprot:11196884-Lingulodinium_polyedra.AAC.1
MGRAAAGPPAAPGHLERRRRPRGPRPQRQLPWLGVVAALVAAAAAAAAATATEEPRRRADRATGPLPAARRAGRGPLDADAGQRPCPCDTACRREVTH